MKNKKHGVAAELPLGLGASDLVTPSALRTTGLVYPGSLNPIAGCVRNHSHGYESSAPHSRHSSALPLGENSGRKQAGPRQIRKQKVINTSRARVDCLHSSQSGYFDIPCSQTTGARTRTRGTAIRNREAYFAKWRVAKFGDDFDPIRVAVDEAVAAFSSGKSEAGQNSDRAIWLKIANRVGLDNFLDAFFQLTSEIRDLGHRDKSLRRPAASFQKLLNERFPLPKEGISPERSESRKRPLGGCAR